jgi:hypothetical protein
MTKQSNEQHPAVRKSVLVIGGIVVGVAALIFAIMTFFGGGGSGEATRAPATTPAPITQSQDSGDNGQPSVPSEGLRAGGRNPFVRG